VDADDDGLGNIVDAPDIFSHEPNAVSFFFVQHGKIREEIS
jgi:hypothetical protein